MKDTDFSWLAEHGVELHQKYAGKWIAVYDGKVVGVGDTATEAAEHARMLAPDGEFILEALDVSGDVIYAGL
jgi:hypothetical protein